MAKYDKASQDELDVILAKIIGELSGEQILAIPGAYEVFSEHFNNEVLERWVEDHPEEEEEDE